MKTLSIRDAKGTDARAITELYLTVRKVQHPYAPLAHTDEVVFNWIQSHLLPSGGARIAEESGKVVGFCAKSQSEGVSWIDQLYIHLDHSHCGIGSALLIDTLQVLPRPVHLNTFQENTPARKFYEKFGFNIIAMGDGSNNEEGAPDILYELLV